MNKILEVFFGQLLALIAFFGFPCIQYLMLKKYTKNEGAPQLWYLPQYGFRIVIRNFPGRHPLTSIRYRALLRRVIPATSQSSSPTYVDDLLHKRDDFFLFPGVDQVLLAFKLEEKTPGILDFVNTDLIGKEITRKSFDTFDQIICDYEAVVKNLFNFNVQLAKRVKISRDVLISIYSDLKFNHNERQYLMDEVINIS